MGRRGRIGVALAAVAGRAVALLEGRAWIVVAVALLVATSTLVLGEVSAGATRARVREAQLSAQAESTKRAAARATGILAGYARTLVDATSPQRDGSAAPIVASARSGDLAGTRAALIDVAMRLPSSGEVYLVDTGGRIRVGFTAGVNLAIEVAQQIRAREYPLEWVERPTSTNPPNLPATLRSGHPSGDATRLGAVFMPPDEFARTFASPAIYLSGIYEPLDRDGQRMSAGSATGAVRPGTLRRARISIGVRIPAVDGSLAGALVADLYDIEFSSAVVEVGASAAEAYLIDGSGRIVHRRSVTANDPETYRDLSAEPVVRRALRGEDVRDDADDPLGGGLRLVASARTPDVPGALRQDLVTGWYVLSTQLPASVYADLDRELADLRAIRVVLVTALVGFALLLAAAIRRANAQRRALAAANASLTEVGAQLEAASRHKSEFLANMSHELRTPLNAIIGFADVLQQRLFGEVNPKQAEYLADISSSGQHLLDLVNEILDLSKVEAGRMELEPREFAASEAILSAFAFVRERAARHGIELAADVPADLGTITADERKVRQVLLNLLSNAVKFTPDGGWIGVTARRAEDELTVSVRDTGIGIAPEDQPRVFEEFRQVGKAGERSREGTGLGLTLARRFVELHGGRIWLESEAGKGTTFTFALPVRPPAVGDLSERRLATV